MTATPNHCPSRAEPLSSSTSAGRTSAGRTSAGRTSAGRTSAGRTSVGVVKWFSPAKGYGFIENSPVEMPSCVEEVSRNRPTACGETEREIFVHHSNVVTRKPLASGDRVRFEKAVGPGGPFAHRVVPL